MLENSVSKSTDPATHSHGLSVVCKHDLVVLASVRQGLTWGLWVMQGKVDELVEQLRVAVVVPPTLEAAFRLIPRSAFTMSHAVTDKYHATCSWTACSNPQHHAFVACQGA